MVWLVVIAIWYVVGVAVQAAASMLADDRVDWGMALSGGWRGPLPLLGAP